MFERADRLLEERAPGMIVVLRQLDTRWRLLHEALDLAGEEEAVAAEVARWLLERANAVLGGGGGLGGADDACAAFADEIEWRARHWASRTRGDRPWWGARLDDEGPPPGALVRGPGPTLAAVVSRLVHLGAVARAIRTASSVGVGALTRAFPAADALRGELEAIGSAGDPPSAPRPALPGWALAALSDLAPGDDPARAAVVVAAVLAAWAPQGAPPSETDRATVLAVARERIGPARPRLVEPSPGPSERLAPEPPPLVSTGFGGVFYLVRLLMEVGCDEALYRACLPEGHALAGALRLLLGEPGEHDPAPEVIGGVDRAVAPVVTGDAMREVCAAVLRRLVEAIPRRALAAFPPLRLSRVDPGLLLATPARAPFVIFAWPGTTPREVEEGLAELFRTWPHAAPPVTAAPALAEVDRSLRVRAQPGPTAALLPAAGDAASRGVLAQVAGATAALFALRAGGQPTTADDFRDRHLAVPGVIRAAGDEIVVTLPMARIDLSVRRAGLDRDPGWVPWLRRVVRIEFEDG